MPKHLNLPRGLRIYVRRQKAQIRRQNIDDKSRCMAIKELYLKVKGGVI